MWDYDIASPPTLMDITVNGQRIRAVAQVTKQSYLYVFDRVTGKPVWPIEEKPVPAGDTPGEWYSPTQPIPSKPAPYDRQGVTERRCDRLHAGAARGGAGDAQGLQDGAAVHAADRGDRDAFAGRCRFRATRAPRNWQGASWDPETNMFYVPSVTNMSACRRCSPAARDRT